MQSAEHETTNSPPSPFRGWLRSRIAQVLVLALIIASLPTPLEAKWRDQSGSLPGLLSSGTIIAIAAAGGAAIGLLIYFGKRSKGSPSLRLDSPPVRFNEFVPGQPTQQAVPITNRMSEPLTVKAVLIEDKSGAVKLAEVRPVPFTLAPGEKFDVPLTLTAADGGGKARLRITAATAKMKKDGVKSIDISYGKGKSKLRKLIPGV